MALKHIHRKLISLLGEAFKIQLSLVLKLFQRVNRGRARIVVTRKELQWAKALDLKIKPAFKTSTNQTPLKPFFSLFKITSRPSAMNLNSSSVRSEANINQPMSTLQGTRIPRENTPHENNNIATFILSHLFVPVVFSSFTQYCYKKIT